MHKKLLFIALTWLCAITSVADTLTILNRFEKIEHASVLASYRNEFGSYRKPNMDVEFPYALIRVHIEGNESAVTKAKERFALYLGQHYTTKAKNTSRVNEIMFLVPVGAGHVELQCGDGCQPLTLFDYSQLTADAIYEGKVRYAMEIKKGWDEPDLVSHQYFTFRVTPSHALVTVYEDGTKENWRVTNGVATKKMKHGTYRYSISATRYHMEEGTFVVSDTDTEKDIVLRPKFGWLSIGGDAKSNGAYVVATNTTTGENYSLGEIPIAKKEMDAGTYALLIQQEKYKDYESVVTISENQLTTITPSLLENFVRVTLSAAAGAEIWLDEQRLGVGEWNGVLELREHIIETRQASHHTSYTKLTVTPEMAGQTIVLKSPVPIYGTLAVHGDPMGAKMYIDGKEVGNTPRVVNKLLIGEHHVQVKKEGYSSYEGKVVIEEDKETDWQYTLEEGISIGELSVRGSDVTNLQVRQEGGEIIVNYDLDTRSHVNIGLFVNDSKNYVELTDATGDVGKVSAGKHHTIVWKPLQTNKTFIVDKATFDVSAISTYDEYARRGNKIVKTLVMGQVGYSPAPQLAYGAMIGQMYYPTDLGWYVNGRSNFNFHSPTDLVCDRGGSIDGEMPFYTGNTSLSHIIVNVGLMWDMSGWLFFHGNRFNTLGLYAGAGYGKRELQWETTDGLWVKYGPTSHAGFSGNIGVFGSLYGVTLNVGVSTINFKYMEIEAGIGFMF